MDFEYDPGVVDEPALRGNAVRRDPALQERVERPGQEPGQDQCARDEYRFEGGMPGARDLRNWVENCWRPDPRTGPGQEEWPGR